MAQATVGRNTKSTKEDCDLSIFKHISMTYCASNNLPILTHKVPKELKA